MQFELRQNILSLRPFIFKIPSCLFSQWNPSRWKKNPQVLVKQFQALHFSFFDTKSFIFSDIRCSILLFWFLSKFITSHEKIQKCIRCHPNWNKKTTSTIAIVSIIYGVIFWPDFFHVTLETSKNLPRKVWLPGGITLIFTDGLLDLQLLDEIKFCVVLCKAYIAATWLLRRKCLFPDFWCKIS